MPPDDRRAELLDRAYRRGYALRRRRRWTAALATLAVVAVVAAGAVSLAGRNDTQKVSVEPSPTTAPQALVPSPCPTSIDAVPAAEVPSDVAAWADGAPVIGEGGLWTVVSALHVGGLLDNQTYRLKFPWYTKPNGLPLITGRRLDGDGTFHADVNLATDAGGAFVVSSLEFSTPGCWEITARFGSSTLEFRLRISPAPSSVVFLNHNDGLGLHSTCDVPAHADPVCDFDILSSDDAGRTWIRVGGDRAIQYPGWRGYPDIELAASGSNVWVYGTRTFESHDGGRTFRAARFDGLVSALVAEGDDVWVASRACALCPTETLLSAPITGGRWTKIAGFPNLADPYAQLVRPSSTVAYVVGSDTHAVLYRTDDAGRSWQPHALPPVPPASSRTASVALAALDSDQVWMLDGGVAPARNQQKALYRSDDGGQNWILVADTAAPRPGVGHMTARGLGLSLTVASAQRMWIPSSGHEGPFIGTIDGGREWFDTRVPTHVEEVFFVDPLHGWAWNGDASYRTTDGKNWIPIGG
jgi:photosystem II stability/assembly factor-like uncharacterized protein